MNVLTPKKVFQGENLGTWSCALFFKFYPKQRVDDFHGRFSFVRTFHREYIDAGSTWTAPTAVPRFASLLALLDPPTKVYLSYCRREQAAGITSS